MGINLTLKHLLAQGERGTVVPLSDDLVLKRVTFEKSGKRELKGKVRLLFSLGKEKNIVRLKKARFHRSEAFLVFERLICLDTLDAVTEEQVIRLGVDICAALEALERRGLVHGDIKPSNIFLRGGDFVLGDMGSVRKARDKCCRITGTPAYAAFEVADCGGDFSSDLYSLGLVMYKLLNGGRLPFMPPSCEDIKEGDSEKALKKRRSGEALPPPEYASPALSETVLKACAFRPEDRFTRAAHMAAALTKLL